MNKQKPVITFDLDGVIVGGDYTSDWELHPRKYLMAPMMEQDVKDYLQGLSELYTIYYISARSFNDCGFVTVQWMLRHNIPVSGGVFVNIASKDKWKIIKALDSKLHVDDHPVVIKSLVYNTIPVMFLGRGNENSWWEKSKETYNNNHHASNWKDLVCLIRRLVPV